MASVVLMPKLGLDENENFLGQMCVSEGDVVKAGDELFVIETDKSTMSVYAEESGTVLKVLYGDNEVVPVKVPVCVIGTPGENIDDLLPASAVGEKKEETAPAAPVETPVMQPAAGQEAREAVSVGETVFSPRAKQLAQANGIVLEQVTATGAEHRALEEDVRRAMVAGVQNAVAVETKPAAVPAKAATQPEIQTPSGCTIKKFTNMRRAISKNMRHSLSTTAQTTQHMRYNASKVQAYRKWLKASPGAEKHITLTDMVAYATVKALQECPYMNGQMVGEDVVMLYDDVNLGMAVHTDRGLMTITVRKAQELSLVELSQAIKELAQKCREGTIEPKDQTDATFTISNMGAQGVTYFTPILNPPQLGILGLGTMDYMVDQTENGITFFPAGYLSFTYDHRANDGVPSGNFFRAIKKHLEEFEV